MCDPFGYKAQQQANTAAQMQIQMMEDQQAAHDTAVTKGKQSIDKAFEQFTPDYYSGVGKAYQDFYNPQIDEQYNTAKDKMVAALAGRDQLNSTTGAYNLGQLDKTRGTAQADVANGAMDAENSLKSSVANAKGQLSATNAATADPLSMASEAQQTAGTLVAPQSYGSVANVFANALSPIASAVKSNSGSMGSNGPGFWTAPLPQSSGAVN